MSMAKTAAKPRIGAHISGGMKTAVGKATNIGAQAIQIFLGSPQMWREPKPTPAEQSTFVDGVKGSSIAPVFVHGNYLVNLASESPENFSKSVNNLALALRLSDSIGAKGLIFHPGSAGKATYDEALNRVLKALDMVLDGYQGDCKLLLEVCAGQGQTIGDRFEEFADILKSMQYDKRIGVCWDTCHMFNAGYDISSKAGLQQTIDQFGELIGFDWLFAIHANDSKTPLGARRDRHENIGKGYIGEEAFRRMLHEPLLRPLPWILEVPGMEKKGPDKINIDLMHSLAN
ncbi:MAG: deoxyribonuclease IV [Candidatus Obscuribacterales bacterium]|nr:MAG: deoxyribonuclease IV [Candidatus Melainabacteria bacterium]